LIYLLKNKPLVIGGIQPLSDFQALWFKFALFALYGGPNCSLWGPTCNLWV